MITKQQLSRIWFYFRAGYGFYFVFIISGLNALMIAYFVVILGTECESGVSLRESGDILCSIRLIFPNFGYFVGAAVAIGIPLLSFIGYLHYQKNQYGAHAHVNWRSNPYQKIILSILLELISEVKLQNKYDKEKTDRLELLQDQLIGFLEDKRLEDKPPDEDYKDF